MKGLVCPQIGCHVAVGDRDPSANAATCHPWVCPCCVDGTSNHVPFNHVGLRAATFFWLLKVEIVQLDVATNIYKAGLCCITVVLFSAQGEAFFLAEYHKR